MQRRVHTQYTHTHTHTQSPPSNCNPASLSLFTLSLHTLSDRDWVLGLIYRFKTVNGLLNDISGLAPVEGVEGVENVGVGKLVGGHEAYMGQMSDLIDMMQLRV